jgi:hypothetical protein
MKRQLAYMGDKQKQELVHIEAMQRMQFDEFTRAWDQYMAQYEQTAFNSIDRLKKEQEVEILNMRQVFTMSPGKYTKSKKLNNYRTMEKKTFAAKNYDGASYFKYLADELETFERLAEGEKHREKFEKHERLIRKRQDTFMNNFLKRV